MLCSKSQLVLGLIDFTMEMMNFRHFGQRSQNISELISKMREYFCIRSIASVGIEHVYSSSGKLLGSQNGPTLL